MLSLFQFYRRRIAGSGPAVAKPRARHVGVRFESLESRYLLSLAPPTIPFIADDYRPTQGSEANTAAWSGGSDDSSTSPSRSVDRSADPESYPAEDQMRPISPAPGSPDITYGNVSPYKPGPDDGDSYSSSPGSSTDGDLIDIGKPLDLQSGPLSSTELPGNQSEAQDVLDVLSALNYVPNKRITKESASPSLTPLGSRDVEELPRPDALGAAKVHETIDDDSIVLQRHPIVETSPDGFVSAAAIDALLELPIKIESVRSTFQAFEVSAGANLLLPIAPASRERPENDFEPSINEVGRTADSNPALCGVLFPSNAGQLNRLEIETSSGEISYLEQPLNSIDESATLDRRLDMITATLITALIGRAVWKLSTESTNEPSPTSATGKSCPAPSRDLNCRHNFGFTILDPRG
jgi:hypothetical protein